MMDPEKDVFIESSSQIVPGLLGFMHTRAESAEGLTSRAKRASWRLLHLRRGKGNEEGGVFVWLTGSWTDEGVHVVEMADGSTHDAMGPLVTTLEVQDGRLFVALIEKNRTTRVPVGLRDRVGATGACSLTKWHVTVRGGLVEKLAIKHADVPREPLHSVEGEATAARPRCKLSDAQMAANMAVPAVAGTASMLVCSVIPPAAALVSWFVPIPVAVLCPFPPKTCRELGSLHERRTGLTQKSKRSSMVRVYMPERVQSTADGLSFFSWSLLSFKHVNNVRVTLHGAPRMGDAEPFRRVWEGGGRLDTSLVARDGQLYLVVCGGVVRFEVPARPEDGVQYVSAGEWPTQTKYHVQVRDGVVESAVVKNSASTGLRLGVRGGGASRAARERARAAGVNRNGASGPGAEPDKTTYASWLRRGFEMAM